MFSLLLHCCCCLYNWDDGVIDTIDWEVHRQATQAQSGRRVHYVKMCHEMLPVGHLVSRYGQGLPDFCALCKTPDENYHHVLRCQHQTRADWRTQTIKKLVDKSVDKRGDPNLTSILRHGLESWLKDVPFDESPYPLEYRTLLQEQRQIGWSHFFQGRVSTKWAALQQRHLASLPPIKGQDGTSWVRSVLQTLFTQWNMLWESRNADQHGRDSATQAKKRKDQVLLQLESLYTLRGKVLQRDRSLFHDHIDDHKKLPTRCIKQWINTYQPLLLKSVKDAKTFSLLHVRPLTHYFG